MKKLSLIPLFFGVILCYSQTTGPCGTPPPIQSLPDRATEATLFLSSMSSILDHPNNVIDGNLNTKAKSTYEQNPYIQFDLGDRYRIPLINVHSEDNISRFYVFASEFPIDPSRSLESLLNDPNIWSNQTLNYTSGNNLYIDQVARYVRLQFNDTRILNISEMDIPGDELGDEICGNHTDDNCDWEVDCDDIQCGVRILNVSKIDASCPICPDGEISIQASGEYLQFSIDGGQYFSNDCWNSFENMCFYTGLPPGTYNVIVRNGLSGCQAIYPFAIVIGSPGVGIDGPCENGGFEHGDFVNWTGHCGYNIIPIAALDCSLSVSQIGLFFDQGLILGRQNILPTQTLVDPLVPQINGNYPALGMYVGRLGRRYEICHGAEELTYCFQVDQSNQDFNFLYALVLQNPENHLPQTQPFFQWTLYRNDGNPPNVNNTIDVMKIISNSNNPFFDVIPGNVPDQTIVYKGWTCHGYDLSPYIGQNLCIEFINADCSIGHHYAYAYIDALCQPHQDLSPVVKIVNNEVYCNQLINLYVEGVGYNRYQWTIAKIDEFGASYETVTLPEEISYDADLFDAKKLYEDNSNFIISCDDKLKFILNVFSDCGSNSTSTEIQLNCAEYNIDYCDIITDCLGDPTERFIGINDCDDCQMTWTPQQYLIMDDPKFPLVTAEFFANAFLQTYYMKAVTPEGCIYRDTIKFKSEMDFLVELEATPSYCDYDLKITLIFEQEVANELIELNVLDLLTPTPYTEYPPVFVESESNGMVKVYKVENISRNEATRMKAIARINTTNQECHADDFCEKTAVLDVMPRSSFIDPWRVYVPKRFSPNEDGINDLWFPTFKGFDENCLNISDINTHVYYAEVTVRDVAGGEMFHVEVMKDPLSTIGVHGMDLAWDGRGPNGQYVPPNDNYECTVEFHSCFPYESIPECVEEWNCDDPNEEYQYGNICGGEHIIVFSFSINVVVY